MAEHNIFGKKGENAAADLLLKKGYTIRERNWRCGKNEIDIIAEKNGRIIIVEVKTRSHEIQDLSQLIGKNKIRHLIDGGVAYLRFHNLPHSLQFDIIVLTGSDETDFSVTHIEDAFMPPMHTYR